MYRELASWWPLLSPPEEYAEEAAFYARTLEEATERPIRTLLELGSGGGHNASHLKTKYALTLVDLSEDMLSVSRELNPTVEHIVGDMRSVRLRRTFDAVFIHDAINYMRTEDDLRLAIETAAAHLSPGGAALFAPDDTVESYRSRTTSGGEDGEGRAMRYLEWAHEPRGSTYHVTYVYVLVEGDGEPRVEWEDHVEGLFPRTTWLRLIEAAGLGAHAVAWETNSHDAPREVFVGKRAGEVG